MSVTKHAVEEFLKKMNVSSLEELSDEQILDFAKEDVDLAFFLNYFTGAKRVYEMTTAQIADYIRKGLTMGKKPEVFIDYADSPEGAPEGKPREFKVIFT